MMNSEQQLRYQVERVVEAALEHLAADLAEGSDLNSVDDMHMRVLNAFVAQYITHEEANNDVPV